MPQGQEKIDCQMPGGWEFFCANARGVPGGMVRAGIEQDIQTVKFFQSAENISLNSEKLRRKTILSQTIFARILTLNATFAPRSPLQPTPRAPRLACLSHYSCFCFIKPSKIRATRIALKLLRSGQKQNLQAFF